MRTGPVSAPNERVPVARGQGKELERNMDGGLGVALSSGGVQGDRGWHLSFGDTVLMANSQHPSSNSSVQK